MVKLAIFLQKNIDLSGEVHLKHDWSFKISPLRLGFGIEASRPAFEPKRVGHTEEKTGKLPQCMKAKVIVLLLNKAHIEIQ